MSVTIGHKTPTIRALIIICGIILIAGVNLLLLVPGSGIVGIVLTVIGGIGSYRLLKQINNIRYILQDDNTLTIKLPGGKTINLSSSSIKKVKKINQTPLTRWQHIGVKKLGNDRYITTSNKNLYEVHTTDGRRIIISPRSPHKIFPHL